MWGAVKGLRKGELELEISAGSLPALVLRDGRKSEEEALGAVGVMVMVVPVAVMVMLDSDDEVSVMAVGIRGGTGGFDRGICDILDRRQLSCREQCV